MVVEQQAAQPAVIIRLFRPEDAEAVRKLVVNGLWSVAPGARQEVWRSTTLYGRLVKAGTVVLPALALAALWKKPAAAQLPGLLASILAMPAVVYGYTFEIAHTYTNKSLKEDLADISATYDTGEGSAFWVAECEGKLVGCVGLQRRSDNVAELRRMSVHADMRGRGIGLRLYEELISHARKKGFEEVFLSTTSAQYAALALYKKLGWIVTEVLEPRMLKYVFLNLKL